jgi:hypothetical protein
MATFWTEPYSKNRPRDHRDGDHYVGPLDRLVPREVYFVKVSGFTFAFHSLEQLEDCLRFFDQKVRATSAVKGVCKELRAGRAGDHGECQRWFERLPLWLLEEPKRLKVVKALKEAAAHFAMNAATR